MPQIVYTDEFINDFERVYAFLAEKNPIAAQNLAKLLEEKLALLTTIPKAFTYFGEFRLYLLEFGSSGYAILYDYNEELNTITILRIKHQKEVGFN
ncbi:MAG: type II toxin-antitoxin system RelE/ParE family toxin [Burkholderiales bacterium]|nr:type II toxin-antitoxin system RelE/ParE family toxin [Burkholderiales bacterium]